MTDEWPPHLPTTLLRADVPLARLARQLLADAGGIASARYVRDEMTHLGREPLTIRQTRDLLKSPKIRKLGAGYFTTQNTVFEPVLDWAERELFNAPPAMVCALIEAILAHYPRGDPEAIRRWIQQEPGRLQLDGDRVRFTPQRWRIR